MKDFQNGTLRVEIWKAFGKGQIFFNTKDSILLPYDGLTTLYFEGGATAEQKSRLSFTPSNLSIIDAAGQFFGNSDGSGVAKIITQTNQTMVVQINRHYYAFFAPSNSSFELLGGKVGEPWITGLKIPLTDKGYLSFALLPRL